MTSSRRVYTPRAFAPMVAQHLAEHPRSALWAKPGMGKSVLALTFLDGLHNVYGEDRPTLILAPLRVARDTWANECEKWEHLRGLTVVPIVGSATERLAALRTPAPVYATNYENLVWLVEHFEKGKKAWPFGTVIADEAQKLKGFRLQQGGARTKALAKVAHKHVDRWINLTGGPVPNGIEDLWGQTWFLDAGQRLGRSFTAFHERWFRPVPAGDYHKWVPTEFAQGGTQDALKDICLALDPKDWFDMKDPIVNVIDVVLPASARAKYKDMEKDMFIALANGNEAEAFGPAGKSMKCLQIANGFIYLDAERYGKNAWVEIHPEKLDALEELGEATGDDVILVAYHFKPDLERLLRRFPDGLDLSTEDGMARAKRGEGKWWFGHPASIGEGVDGLQEHCHTIVFFAQDWNMGLHDQIIERIGPMRQLQSGKDKPVFIHYLVAKGTVDEVVMLRRTDKRSVQDLLLEYMKGKI